MKYIKVFAATLFFLVNFLFLPATTPHQVFAADSCNVTVTPTSVQTNTGTSFTFAITNTGTAPIVFIKLARPSTNFTLENRGVPGWSVSANSTQAEMDGGSIAVGNTYNLTYYAVSGSAEASSANWQVSVSSGGSLVDCTGSLGTAISGVTDTTAPIITDLVASNVTNSSATISWTTDENSSSIVNYNSEEQGQSTATGDSGVTSHTVNIGGLAAGIIYYFNACSSDSLGNERCSVEDSFTTSTTASSTPTPTTSVIIIQTTPTPTPVPTPIPRDTTPPQVNIKTEFNKPFEVAPLITGTAQDNKTISSVDYSTDGGKNWLPVDTTESLGTNKVTYEFTPFVNEDGNYIIQVRALDLEGNIGKSQNATLIIDRLPPLVGGNLISLGPQPLMPNSDGTIVALAGLGQKITLSAIGGPIAIDLFVGEKKIPLKYSPETTLWSGFLDLTEVGIYTLTAHAVDGANNKTTRELNAIQVIANGKIINKQTGIAVIKGSIKVYNKDTQTNEWNLWDAKAFDQENPQAVSQEGEYQLFLPPGTYYFQIESPGFSTLKSNIFILAESKPINSNFTLEEGRILKLGPIKIPLPSFLQKTLAVNLELPNSEEVSTFNSNLIGEPAPSLSIENNNTKIISFVSTWSPPSLEQISILNNLVENKAAPITMVTSQETKSKIDIFRKRGNYTTPIIVDPDGELVEKYKLTTYPTHYILDNRGRIVEIITQVLSEQQLLEYLVN